MGYITEREEKVDFVEEVDGQRSRLPLPVVLVVVPVLPTVV